MVLNTKLQNGDVLKGIFNLFFDEGKKLFTLKPSRFTISISELGSFRRRKEGLEKCIKDAQKSILMTSFASSTWVYFFQSALEEVRHCYCKYLFRIFYFAGTEHERVGKHTKHTFIPNNWTTTVMKKAAVRPFTANNVWLYTNASILASCPIFAPIAEIATSRPTH